MNNKVDSTNEIAYLSNNKDIISFTFGDKIIRFRGPYSLDKISRIIEWDKGYIVIMAKYHHSHDEIEDYIDLVPILDNLYIDADNFLKPIKEVKLRYV